MNHSSSSSGKHAEPSSARAELQGLLEDAMPHVQAALRRLLEIVVEGGALVTQQQLWHVQELLAGVQMCSIGRDDSLKRVHRARQVMQHIVLLGDHMVMPEIARGAVAEHLLEPAPARAALLRLLAAVVQWEPGVQLPAASCKQQQQWVDVGACRSVGEREGQGEEEAEQAQGADGRLVEEEEGLVLSDLRDGTCALVSKLLDCPRKPLVLTYDVHSALLSLEFGCSLLQTPVLRCLSRHLAAVSEGLLGQLPPEAAALCDELQQRQNQEASQTAPAQPFTGLQSAQTHHSAATTSGPGLGTAHMAQRTLSTASVLLSGLHGLLVTAADAFDWAGAAGDTGLQHSSRPLQQQPRAEDVSKTLRQLSRRYLLLLAGELRDSHVLDHWARAVLLAGLCRGAGERGGEKEGTEAVVSAAAGEGLPSEGSKLEQLPQQQQTQWPGEPKAWLHPPPAPGARHIWACLGAIGRVLEHCKAAREADSGAPLSSLPPGLDAALHQALSGPCTQHLTLALGILMLHQADGGSLYGMPLPYRTGDLAAAVGQACRRLSPFQQGAAPQEGLQVIDQDLYLSIIFMLSHPANGAPLPPPAVPPEGRLNLLLRLGQLAVRSAQAYRRQEGATGPQGVLVIGKEYTGGAAMTALWAARTLISSRCEEALAGAGGRVGTVEGPNGGLGGAAGSGAVEGAAGRGKQEGGSGWDRAGAVAEGQANAGQLGTGEAVASSVGQPARSTAAAAGAAGWAARAAVAAETRWHRLLLKTWLWVEMEEGELVVWVQHWNKFCRQQGCVPKDAGGRRSNTVDHPGTARGIAARRLYGSCQRAGHRIACRERHGACGMPCATCHVGQQQSWYSFKGLHPRKAKEAVTPILTYTAFAKTIPWDGRTKCLT